MIGQVNLNSKLGKSIYDFVSRDDIKTIVEIGTWNGYGSTECIKKSIIENNKKDYVVFSLEINESMYNIAQGNTYPDNFHLLLGTIVDESDLGWMNWDEYFNSPEGFYHGGNKMEWYQEDILNLRKTKNVIGLIPVSIDLLILDGGEFTTYPEFLKLKDRCRFIMLDDTKELKCKKIREEMLSDSENYNIIVDDLSDRNGILVAEVKIKNQK